MRSLVLGGTLLCASLAFGPRGDAMGIQTPASSAQSSRSSEPVVLMGCVSGGNLQPVEQPFVLVPSEPFVLSDVVTLDGEFAPTDYRVTGINMTPWLGLRVKIEGTLASAGTTREPADADALPEIKATSVHSIWGTCPSPPAWTPTTLPDFD